MATNQFNVPISYPIYNYAISMLKNNIHIWWANVDDFSGKYSQLRDILSNDELKKTAQYSLSKDKNNFTIRRGLLRILASQYSGAPPKTIHFDYTKNGKPVLRDYKHIHFNISRSKNMVVFAFSSNPIGIDIELLRSIPDFDDMAKIAFSNNEYQMVRSLTGNDKKRIFFNIWTKKEALLKAIGVGLNGLNDLRSQSLSNNNPSVIHTRGSKWFTYYSQLEQKYMVAYTTQIIKPALYFCISKNICNFPNDFSKIMN